MNQKDLIIITGFLLILGFLGEVLTYFEINNFDKLTVVFTGIGRIAGLILILSKGTLIKTKSYYKLILIFIGFTVLGVMIKIMHWPNGNLILLFGLSCTLLIYDLHFYKKPTKNLLDYIKLIWLTLFICAAIFTIQHYPFGNELKNIEGILFLIMFLYFAIKQIKLGKDRFNFTDIIE